MHDKSNFLLLFYTERLIDLCPLRRVLALLDHNLLSSLIKCVQQILQKLQTQGKLFFLLSMMELKVSKEITGK